MKVHEYLWEYVDLQAKTGDMSPEEVQGHMRQYLGGEQLISDTDGAELSEREALSIYGRNYDRLREAYQEGSKPLFAAVCMYQQMSDDEWQKAKEEAEKAAQEAQEGPEGQEHQGEPEAQEGAEEL